MTVRPRRSVLYMPGSNARALEKARGIAADALILDLEDAVAPDAKELARRQVADAVKAKGFGKREVVIRINALSTAWGVDDLKAAADAAPDAILVPKVSSAKDLDEVETFLGKAQIAVWAMVETPLAILNIAEIAGAGGRLACSSWARTISSRNSAGCTRPTGLISQRRLGSPSRRHARMDFPSSTASTTTSTTPTASTICANRAALSASTARR